MDQEEKENKPCLRTRAKEKWAGLTPKTKKIIGGVTALAIILLIVIIARSGCGQTMKTRWSSPDFKLLKKNPKGVRTDPKNDNWSKEDFMESVSRFNNIAAANQN
jgi:hypothetical protein